MKSVICWSVLSVVTIIASYKAGYFVGDKLCKALDLCVRGVDTL